MDAVALLIGIAAFGLLIGSLRLLDRI